MKGVAENLQHLLTVVYKNSSDPTQKEIFSLADQFIFPTM